MKSSVEIVPDWTSDAFCCLYACCLDRSYLLNLPKLPAALVNLKRAFSVIAVWNPVVIRSGRNQTHQWWKNIIWFCENGLVLFWLVGCFFFSLWWPVLWASNCHSSKPHLSCFRKNTETLSVSSVSTGTSITGTPTVHWGKLREKQLSR